MKVATFVSGKVPSDKRAEFIAGYAIAKSEEKPPGLERSFLMRGIDDPDSYTIQTVWESRDALEAMRKAGKPKALELFERVGASPRLWIHEVEETIP